MKTIGLIGGMSCESTSEYYRIINQTIKHKCGGLHSGKVVIYSVDFAEIESLQHLGEWHILGNKMSEIAVILEKSGVDGVMLCTNTMHKLEQYVVDSIKVPFLHIADATAYKILEDKIKKVGLLGTKFTMEQDFYKSRLSDKFAIDVIIPSESECQLIHNIIYKELCLGMVSELSKHKYLSIINHLIERGAEAIILGCTEIELLIQQDDCSVKLYPTAKIHAEHAVEFMLSV